MANVAGLFYSKKYLIFSFSSDDYNESNAGGYVNLGTAVNGLCEGTLAILSLLNYVKKNAKNQKRPKLGFFENCSNIS